MYILLSIAALYILFFVTGGRSRRMKSRIRKTMAYENVTVIPEDAKTEGFIPLEDDEIGEYVTESKSFFIKEFEIESENVDEKMSYLAVFPKNYDANKKYPGLFLLHGLRDIGHDWIAKARLLDHYELLLEEKKIGSMIIILPNSGYNSESWYSDFKKKENKRYETYFVEELIPDVKSRFNVSNLGISGFSMGGYGAFKLGLKHLELFQVIGSFAGAISLVRLSINKRVTRVVKFIYLPEFLFKSEDKERFITIFGSWGREIMKEDPYTLIKYLDKAEQQGKNFYLSVGAEDKEPYLMVHQWVDMIGRIKRFNFTFQGRIYKGETHTWSYVAKDLGNFLKYSWSNLK
ncbi:MAG: esterase [Psychrilyobacter sp.]|nr:esterase [Psychrilyobacter sp.]